MQLEEATYGGSCQRHAIKWKFFKLLGLGHLVKAVTKRCKVVRIYVALNAAVSWNSMKHNDMTEFIAEFYSLKNLKNL